MQKCMIIPGTMPWAGTANRAAPWREIRRWVAGVCLILFAMSGIAHAVQCMDGFPPKSAQQQSVSADDEGTKCPTLKALTLHCHGCAAAIELGFSPKLALAVTSETPAMTPAQLLTPGAPDYEPPPPKPQS